MRRPGVLPFVLVFLIALPVAGAQARTVAAPTVTSVRPLKLGIGDTLVIHGHNFIPGRFHNTIAFQRVRARAVFVRADNASATRILVRIPTKLLPFLRTRAGKPIPTRFALRVLSRRFARRFTRFAQSPVISATGKGTGGVIPGCSAASAAASPNGDADGDLLSNSLEAQLKTDPCNADTDGDGVEDGYEYFSAKDLNANALPYPGERSYPNPLDGSDANADQDGDGMTTAQEFAMWVRYGGHTLPLNYSAGLQYSAGALPVLAGEPQLDINGDGKLSDDERDVDGDGLSNWDEANGRLTAGYWAAIFKTEKPYAVSYPGVDYLDPDSDGDGVKDGADDIDHDGVNNILELHRGSSWVQPFNPCLPDYKSAVCSLHPPVPSESYPPFDTNTLALGALPPAPLPCPYKSSTTVCLPSP